MKSFKLTFVLLLLLLLLTSCDSGDGRTDLVIPYSVGSKEMFIGVYDTADNNGIYVDEKNMELHCGRGLDRRIILPTVTEIRVFENPEILLYVEAVCQMGQTDLDKLVGIFLP